MMYTDTPQSKKENENTDQFWNKIYCKYIITSEFLNELSEFPPIKMPYMLKDNKLWSISLFSRTYKHTKHTPTNTHTITYMWYIYHLYGTVFLYIVCIYKHMWIWTYAYKQ